MLAFSLDNILFLLLIAVAALFQLLLGERLNGDGYVLKVFLAAIRAGPNAGRLGKLPNGTGRSSTVCCSTTGRRSAISRTVCLT